MCSVDGCIGWAPPSYLKKCEGKMEDIESDDSDEEFLGDMMCKEAIHSGPGEGERGVAMGEGRGGSGNEGGEGVDGERGEWE